MQMIDKIDPVNPHSDAPVGYLLGGLSLLAFVGLLHHPVGHGREPLALLESIRSQTLMDQTVHAALAITYGLLNAAMIVFSARLGLSRFPAILGVIAFSCAFVMTLLATMTDGFVIPAIVAHCEPNPLPACVSEAFTLLRLSAIQIEFMTRFSLFGVALAVVAWSAALLSSHEMPRWAGLVGLASGVGQLALVLSVSGRLTPTSLLPIFAAQIVWYLVSATLMVFRVGRFAATAKSN